MAAGSAAIFFSSRMSPAAFTMHTLTVSRDTSRPAKYSIFLSLGCHIECQDSRLGPTARLLHLYLAESDIGMGVRQISIKLKRMFAFGDAFRRALRPYVDKSQPHMATRIGRDRRKRR